MSKWTALLVIVCVCAVAYLLRDATPGMKLGDYVSYWVLTVTLGVEGFILFFGFYTFRHDPFQAHLAEMRAELEMAKQDKRAGRRWQTKGF